MNIIAHVAPVRQSQRRWPKESVHHVAEVEIAWAESGSIPLVFKNYVSLLGASCDKTVHFDTGRLVTRRETEVVFLTSPADGPKSVIVSFAAT